MNDVAATGKQAADKQGPQPLLERLFGLSASGSNVRTEFVAGLTTFLTMVYIVFVNPQILGSAGMDKGAVFVATCIAAAVSTTVMALYANYPIALAPGMGLNAFFAFTVVLTMKYTWQQALAAVFCSGVIFFLISVFRIREYIINSIPRESEIRHLGRRRPVSRHHRARGIQDRGGEPGDAGDARRSAQPGGDPVPRRPRSDNGAQLPADRRRHAHRHSHRHRRRPAVRTGEIFRRGRDAAVAGADIPQARFLAHRRRFVPDRDPELSCSSTCSTMPAP